jgi:large subunit ribosomal protein L17
MRHKKSGRKFNRTPAHRKAMFRNMARALITHGRIRTTEAKAKELRGVVEKLVTIALRDDLHARRQVYQTLGSHGLVKKLFEEIAPVFHGVPGGYTRTLKLGLPRPGDAAPLALIEFTRSAQTAATPAADASPEKPEKAEKPEKE